MTQPGRESARSAWSSGHDSASSPRQVGFTARLPPAPLLHGFARVASVAAVPARALAFFWCPTPHMRSSPSDSSRSPLSALLFGSCTESVVSLVQASPLLYVAILADKSTPHTATGPRDETRGQDTFSASNTTPSTFRFAASGARTKPGSRTIHVVCLAEARRHGTASPQDDIIHKCCGTH